MNILEKTISVMTPYDCLVCEREGALICNWCLLNAFDSVPSRCFMCKKASNDFQTCSKCRRSSPLNRVFVATPYNKTAKKLIHAMKLGSAREATTLITSYMNDEVPFLPNYIVTGVPTAPVHVRQRGFDHTKRIAEEFASLRGLAYVNLLKRYDGSKQVGASRKQRLSQLRGMFEVVSNAKKDKSILLIDDVTTTGSSLIEAAKTLRKAGVKHVDALVFAQTI